MPIQAGVGLSEASQNQLLENQAAFRNSGPSAKIGEAGPMLRSSIKHEIPSLVRTISVAVDSGKPISAQAQELLLLYQEKFTDDPDNIPELKPRDYAMIWTVAQEAIGEVPIFGKDGRKLKTPDQDNIGGIKDKESIFYKQGKHEQDEADANLRKLSHRIEKHLTGEHVISGLGSEIWDKKRHLLTPWSGKIHFRPSVRAAESFQANQDLPKITADLVEDLHKGKEWGDLSLEEKRNIRQQALEATSRRMGSRSVEAVLTKAAASGTDPDKDTLAKMMKGNSGEKWIATKLADKTLMGGLLRDRKQIRGMRSMDDMLGYLKVDARDPALTTNDLVEGVIKNWGIYGDEADKLRKNPTAALDILKKDSTASAVCIRRVLLDKATQHALKEDAKVPAELKKGVNGKLESSAELRKSLDHKDAAFALMLEIGSVGHPDPSSVLMRKLGLSQQEANDFVAAGNKDGILVSANTGGPAAYGEPIKVQTDNMVKWATPEMLAGAYKKGLLSLTDLKSQKEALLKTNTAAYPDQASVDKEVNRWMKELKEDYLPALDINSGPPTNEQVKALKKMGPKNKQLAIMAMNGLLAMGMILPRLTDDEQKQFSQFFN